MARCQEHADGLIYVTGVGSGTGDFYRFIVQLLNGLNGNIPGYLQHYRTKPAHAQERKSAPHNIGDTSRHINLFHVLGHRCITGYRTEVRRYPGTVIIVSPGQ